MIPNLYLGNGGLTKHPLKECCLGYQEQMIEDTPPKMNECPLKKGPFFKKKSSSKHDFSEDIASFRGCVVSIPRVLKSYGFV